MTRFLIILMGFCLAPPAPAATLYVSTNGASSTPEYRAKGSVVSIR